MAKEENPCSIGSEVGKVVGSNESRKGRIERKILDACQTPKKLAEIANSTGLSYSYCWGRVAMLVVDGRLLRGKDSESKQVMFQTAKVVGKC